MITDKLDNLVLKFNTSIEDYKKNNNKKTEFYMKKVFNKFSDECEDVVNTLNVLLLKTEKLYNTYYKKYINVLTRGINE